MNRNWISALVLACMLIVPAAVRAHDGHMHKALGTVASITGEQVDIKTTDGKSLTVMLDKKTTLTRGKETLDVTALKIGERVSVDYMEKNKVKTAHAIKLATATTAKK